MNNKLYGKDKDKNLVLVNDKNKHLFDKFYICEGGSVYKELSENTSSSFSLLNLLGVIIVITLSTYIFSFDYKQLNKKSIDMLAKNLTDGTKINLVMRDKGNGVKIENCSDAANVLENGFLEGYTITEGNDITNNLKMCLLKNSNGEKVSFKIIKTK